jgi:hypothetical protein
MKQLGERPMNMNHIINMIIRQIMNRVIRKGINSGMNAVANNHHRAKSTTSATPQGAITAANGQNLSVI